MKRPTFLALTLLTSATLALPLAAHAQQPAAGTSATQHTVKKKHTVKKPVHKKTKKGVSHKAAKAIEVETPIQTPTERLTEAELQTAQQIYTGTFPCELGEYVTVAADEAHPGFFTVTSGKRRYYMHPVESRTGAIRMEDNRLGAVWLQLGPKSMLMDQKEGQRVADDCEAAAQKDYVQHMHDQPQSDLLNPSANGQHPQQAPNPAAAAPAAAPASPETPSSTPAPTASDDTLNQAPASAEQSSAEPTSGDRSPAP
jgi:hypothetical protein